jgi:hypothetical protein
MSISAMKQALNALEVLLRDYGAVHDAGDLEMQPAFHQAHVAVEKLRQAIAEAEKQEPVAWVNWCAATGNRSVSFECESELASQPLYTTPQPQREWIGLTDDEFFEVAKIAEHGNYLVAFRRIQAKLKEKNT